MRLLGDAVLRKVAWEVADQLGSASTYDAEYIALTTLQADALVAMEDDLAPHGCRGYGAWRAREACHRAGSSRSMPRVTSRSSCSWNQMVWYESRLSATWSSSPCLARSSADARRGP